ncbi:MAG: DUF3426 domain-containing protein [Gammaproteobacteria bacterium]|nr:DUF3426 domain-containing protein [Gammaproteobacteria bacterium]
MFTECPSCHTVFRITSDQLKVADGKVKCGRCSTVFSALATLSESEPKGLKKTKSSESSIQQQIPATEMAGADDAGEPSGMGLSIMQEPESAQASGLGLTEPVAPESVPASGLSLTGFEEPAAAGSPLGEISGDEFGLTGFEEPKSSGSEEFSDLDLNIDPGELPDDEDDPFGKLEASRLENISQGDLSGFDFTTDDDDAARGVSEKDFDLGLDSEPASEQERGVKSDVFDLGAEEGAAVDQRSGINFDADDLTGFGEVRMGSSIEGIDTSVIMPAVGDEDSPAMRKMSARKSQRDIDEDSFDTELPTELQAELEDDFAASERYVLEELDERRGFFGSTLSLIGWGVVTIILVAVLIAQFAYFKRYDLMANESTRPRIEEFCSLISAFVDCNLRLPKDLKKLEMKEQVVKSHPTKKGALSISAVIVNNASFYQRFPQLEINFTNVNNEIVATRLFLPKDYVENTVDIEKGMTPDVPWRIMLEIVDPGKEAHNFEFTFR